ncbi:MAG: murein L,D-transpeptidase catalytic domain family protein [Puia sp.]|nr:murein L,D-transpeptidase catalytic domain family protein [Puia sp.]
MKTLPYQLSKIMFFLMILTAPAMIAGNNKMAGFEAPASAGPANLPYYSSAVIKKFIKYTPAAMPLFSKGSDNRAAEAFTVKASPVSLELKSIINQANSLYDTMHLAVTGLNPEAFEYAWRGYHNLLKKGVLNKTGVLSICDFSQSSRMKRMYVIDIQHRKLLFRTYVAHGQNSGAEYASSFSNIPESGKSSLGFYITGRTYYGKNGLSLKIRGLDKGYNDQALKRNIVLHGSSYICNQYLRNFGIMGTSLGCPAIPAPLSPKIIRVVKNGSCLFIYHPTHKYLAESTVINGGPVYRRING